MTGEPEFLKVSQKLVFGEKFQAENANRIVTVQSLSGTGALRLATEFFKRFLPNRTVYLPDPTWANHKQVCADSGLNHGTYTYYDTKTRGLNFEGFIHSLESLAPGSIVLLHAVAHNPTGVDPTLEQWQAVAKVVTEKKLVTFFDLAYQGFASGDLDKDAAAIRLWSDLGLEFFVAQSYAKNFGLYGERAGCVHVLLKDGQFKKAVSDQLGLIVRAMYSNPPGFGAYIVKTVINDPELYKQWKADLVTMSSRLFAVRKQLYDALVALNTPGDWSHIVKQIGMFTYTGLTASQVESIIKNHHVFMLNSGRISLAGLNQSNIEYVAKAINAVVLEAESKL